MAKTALFLCIVLALTVGQGLAINCHICTTTSGATGCLTGSVSTSNSVNCPTGVCLTTTTYTSTSTTTTRACGASALPSSCRGTNGVLVTCLSTCSTNNCNSGTNTNTLAGGSLKLEGGNILIAISMLAALFIQQFLG
uniref:lymphocyte antigen 6D-like isoform X1 n=1 Tax=Ciona intestinalis TaxID=7719 RepID=UPI00006A35D6|nr:lymphocyte antigen 6D-like isoform X1 [Ciona intestinalis]XP_026692942.1 lymphocyte antigen 6D-like isoform X2 [Ciona intestinalis]|eukprot:XP_002122388.1 lymphocyte antigen 6D-like isoform X1 [Ciona intestinalis]